MHCNGEKLLVKEMLRKNSMLMQTLILIKMWITNSSCPKMLDYSEDNCDFHQIEQMSVSTTNQKLSSQLKPQRILRKLIAQDSVEACWDISGKVYFDQVSLKWSPKKFICHPRHAEMAFFRARVNVLFQAWIRSRWPLQLNVLVINCHAVW